MSTWAIVMGDHVEFALASRRAPRIPKKFGLYLIISKGEFQASALYVAPCLPATCKPSRAPTAVRLKALKYYGAGTEVFCSEVEIPDSGWHRLGVVRAVGYDRQGERKDWPLNEPAAGPKGHPFRPSQPPVELFEHESGSLWMLRPPPGSVITEDGFIDP